MSERVVEVRVRAPLPPDATFKAFTEQFFDWWPRDYSYSGQLAENLLIGREVGALCSEIGPSGFRIDFGRVLEWSAPNRLAFSWQISPDSRPEPDPSKASRVRVEFTAADSGTDVTLTHDQFAKRSWSGRRADKGSSETVMGL